MDSKVGLLLDFRCAPHPAVAVLDADDVIELGRGDLQDLGVLDRLQRASSGGLRQDSPGPSSRVLSRSAESPCETRTRPLAS